MRRLRGLVGESRMGLSRWVGICGVMSRCRFVSMSFPNLKAKSEVVASDAEIDKGR